MVAPINEYTLEDNTVFSIVGKGLKLNTAADVKEFVDTIEKMDDLQVIKLSGNTIGVEAGQALGEVLKSKSKLKVYSRTFIYMSSELLTDNNSKLSCPIFSQVVYCQKFLLL